MIAFQLWAQWSTGIGYEEEAVSTRQAFQEQVREIPLNLDRDPALQTWAQLDNMLTLARLSLDTMYSYPQTTTFHSYSCFRTTTWVTAANRITETNPMPYIPIQKSAPPVCCSAQSQFTALISSLTLSWACKWWGSKQPWPALEVKEDWRCLGCPLPFQPIPQSEPEWFLQQFGRAQPKDSKLWEKDSPVFTACSPCASKSSGGAPLIKGITHYANHFLMKAI